jgi:hypothetical protein
VTGSAGHRVNRLARGLYSSVAASTGPVPVDHVERLGGQERILESRIPEWHSTCFVAHFSTAPLHLVRYALRLDHAQHCDRCISVKRVCNLRRLYGPQTPPTKLVVSPLLRA